MLGYKATILWWNISLWCRSVSLEELAEGSWAVTTSGMAQDLYISCQPVNHHVAEIVIVTSALVANYSLLTLVGPVAGHQLTHMWHNAGPVNVTGIGLQFHVITWKSAFEFLLCKSNIWQKTVHKTTCNWCIITFVIYCQWLYLKVIFLCWVWILTSRRSFWVSASTQTNRDPMRNCSVSWIGCLCWDNESFF